MSFSPSRLAPPANTLPSTTLLKNRQSRKLRFQSYLHKQQSLLCREFLILPVPLQSPLPLNLRHRPNQNQTTLHYRYQLVHPVEEKDVMRRTIQVQKELARNACIIQARQYFMRVAKAGPVANAGF